MSGTMGPDPKAGHEPHTDLAAYALGLLDDGERREVEDHLASCPACRVELNRYEDVVGDLGAMSTPVPPTPALRERLLADIRAMLDLASRRRRHVPLAWLAIAASIAVISLVTLGFLLAVTIEERDEAQRGERAIARYVRDGGTMSALVPAPGAADDVAEGHGTLAMVPDGSRAMVIVYDLPPSGGEYRYVAWADRDGDRVELGDLEVDEQGVGWMLLYPPDPMASYEMVGITRYAPGAPDGEPFLVAPVQ
jgi:hypothetical protein